MLNASSKSVSAVHKGPHSDALDQLEATKVLEARLRCDLLRAQIRSIEREQELSRFVTRRGVQRLDCVVVLTLVALAWEAFGTADPQQNLVSALTMILALLAMSGTKLATRRSH